ncbi:dicarboxylate transporter/tellurite-resistance protein TehA, partial [Morganella morganii]|nr:dicarboxylate transporter/tellurite-resistance protein TehA [Morganella morganii]
VNQNHIYFFAKILLGYGLLQLVFMIRLIPLFTQQAFTLSFWSFSFGVWSLAKSSLNISMSSDNDFIHLLSFTLFIFSNAFFLFLVVISLRLLF